MMHLEIRCQTWLKLHEGDIGPSEVLGGSASEFSPTQLASAFAAIANGGTYNNAHSIRKVVTRDGETIEYDHTSHKAMSDYTCIHVS